MALYKIPIDLYLVAFDEEQAIAAAECNVFAGTLALRKANSGWITDETTIMQTAGEPVEVTSVPSESYNKEKLSRIWGDTRAINHLNYLVNMVHP